MLAEKALGVNGVVGLSRAAEVLAGSALPKWIGVVPQPNFSRFPQTSQQTATVVFFPSCLTRVMGAGLTPGQSTIIETVVMIAERAGQPVWIPPDSPGHCCGMPFSSKGYTQAFHEILHRTLERFWAWSEHGRLPIVIDSSSCAYTLLTCREHLSPADQARWEQLTLLDPSDYLYRLILPSLRVRRLPWSVTLHPNCSAVKLELHDKMAANFASGQYVHDVMYNCGWVPEFADYLVDFVDDLPADLIADLPKAKQSEQPHDGESFDVELVVTVPLASVGLEPAESAHRGRVSIAYIVEDPLGRTTEPRAQTFPVQIANRALYTALGQQASFTFKIVVRPGLHRFAVAIRDELSAASSSTSLAFRVGPESG